MADCLLCWLLLHSSVFFSFLFFVKHNFTWCPMIPNSNFNNFGLLRYLPLEHWSCNSDTMMQIFFKKIYLPFVSLNSWNPVKHWAAFLNEMCYKKKKNNNNNKINTNWKWQEKDYAMCCHLDYCLRDIRYNINYMHVKLFILLSTTFVCKTQIKYKPGLWLQ